MTKRPGSRAGKKPAPAAEPVADAATAVEDQIRNPPGEGAGDFPPEELANDGKDPADGKSPSDEQAAPPANAAAKEPTVADVRKMLSDKYPHANAKEVSEQMLVQLARFPRRVQEAPKRKVTLHVQMTVETVAWFHELMAHAWPSRRSRK